MDVSAIELHQLQQLIGRELGYRGRLLQIVEVLAEGPALVMMERGAGRAIQANQFDEPGRRAPATWTIPLHAPGGRELHPLLREMQLFE